MGVVSEAGGVPKMGMLGGPSGGGRFLNQVANAGNLQRLDPAVGRCKPAAGAVEVSNAVQTSWWWWWWW
jgi:hypothetical protein